MREHTWQDGNRFVRMHDGLNLVANASLPELTDEMLRLAERVRELEGTVAMRDGTLAMAVARLGGEVEGAPTHRGNFLQRIDALRQAESRWTALEEEAQLLRRRNDTQAETIGIYMTRQDADRARIAELEDKLRALAKRE